MTRSQAREAAFLLTFEKIFNPEESLENLSEWGIKCELFGEDDYTLRLARQSFNGRDAADEIITGYARGWRLERLPKVTLAILRNALAEILYFEDIPDSVSVNEAVELAKKYATAEDASFINGLLGAYIRNARSGEGNEQ